MPAMGREVAGQAVPDRTGIHCVQDRRRSRRQPRGCCGLKSSAQARPRKATWGRRLLCAPPHKLPQVTFTASRTPWVPPARGRPGRAGGGAPEGALPGREVPGEVAPAQCSPRNCRAPEGEARLLPAQWRAARGSSPLRSTASGTWRGPCAQHPGARRGAPGGPSTAPHSCRRAPAQTQSSQAGVDRSLRLALAGLPASAGHSVSASRAGAGPWGRRGSREKMLTWGRAPGRGRASQPRHRHLRISAAGPSPRRTAGRIRFLPKPLYTAPGGRENST